MNTEQIDIGPGEEKLGHAFELIASLQQLLAALSQRTEVDALVISLLLARVEDPRVALQHWRSKMADFYPQRALDHLGNQYMARSSDELNRRVAHWTRALESLAQMPPMGE